MIVKMYIQKHLFHLPRKQDDLTEMIKERFYKRKPLVKSGITKLYRISDVENKTIKYEKNVNIFLVNLYLLLLEDEGKLLHEEDIQITLSDENIIKEISKITGEKLNGSSIEEIERTVHEHLNSKEKGGNNKTHDKSINVEFSLDWVKKMNRRLKE